MKTSARRRKRRRLKDVKAIAGELAMAALRADRRASAARQQLEEYERRDRRAIAWSEFDRKHQTVDLYMWQLTFDARPLMLDAVNLDELRLRLPEAARGAFRLACEQSRMPVRLDRPIGEKYGANGRARSL